MDGPAPYDPRSAYFFQELTELFLPDLAPGDPWELVGSSAVPGMPGSGVLDVLWVAPGRASAVLEKRGYALQPVSWSADLRSAHGGDRVPVRIFFADRETRDTRSLLAVRDFLRENPEEARKFGGLQDRAAFFRRPRDQKSPHADLRRYTGYWQACQYQSSEGLVSNNGDLEHYLERVNHFGGPVLELGCGSGRLLVPLLRQGHRVAGIDLSFPLINMALVRVRRECPERESACRLLVGDTRTTAFPGRYRVILCAFNSFDFVWKEEDRRALLRKIEAALEPGGAFLMDLVDFDAKRFHDGPRYYDWGPPLKLPGGRTLWRKVRIDLFPAENRVRYLFTFRIRSADGTERHEDCPLDSSTDSNARYRELLEEAGFSRIEYAPREFVDASGRTRTHGFFAAEK